MATLPRDRGPHTAPSPTRSEHLRDDLTTASGAKTNLNPNTHHWGLEGVVGRGVGKGHEGM